MSAIVGVGAQKINADVAGLTSSEPITPSVQGPQWSEIQSGIGTEYGGLSNLFGSGAIVDTAIVKPTTAVVGRLGGLVPDFAGGLAPGPNALPQPVNDGVNDLGIVQSSMPGQVAQSVAAVPGGYAAAAAQIQGGWSKLKALFVTQGGNGPTA